MKQVALSALVFASSSVAALAQPVAVECDGTMADSDGTRVDSRVFVFDEQKGTLGEWSYDDGAVIPWCNPYTDCSLKIHPNRIEGLGVSQGKPAILNLDRTVGTLRFDDSGNPFGAFKVRAKCKQIAMPQPAPRKF